MTPLSVALVIVAGAGGAVLRYLVARAGAKAAWPWPVLLVNVLGSLLAGFAFHTELSLIAVTGFAGGLTTFSTFSVETVQLGARGRWRAAVASVALNLAVGLAAAAVGWAVGLAVFGG
jgi:CrcB protein